MASVPVREIRDCKLRTVSREDLTGRVRRPGHHDQSPLSPKLIESVAQRRLPVEGNSKSLSQSTLRRMFTFEASSVLGRFPGNHRVNLRIRPEASWPGIGEHC